MRLPLLIDDELLRITFEDIEIAGDDEPLDACGAAFQKEHVSAAASDIEALMLGVGSIQRRRLVGLEVEDGVDSADERFHLFGVA